MCGAKVETSVRTDVSYHSLRCPNRGEFGYELVGFVEEWGEGCIWVFVRCPAPRIYVSCMLLGLSFHTKL